MQELPVESLVVASFAEAWIEIKGEAYTWQDAFRVASFAEAWIEIELNRCFIIICSRLLRGGVD